MNSHHQYLLVLAGLFTASWFGWQEVKAQGADWLPIRYVRIEGAFQYIAKDKVKSVLRNHVLNGLFNADIQQIQVSVKQLPWVEGVSVKRVWPDAINISVDEQMPVVRWGEEGLLNVSGDIFVPENINKFEGLPLLTGPIGQEKKLLERFKGLTVALFDQSLQLDEFEVNNRRAWKIKLKNGMELRLGRNEPFEKFQQFLKTLEVLGDEQVTKVAVVDLRYPNGYAVTWKQGIEKIDWKKIAEMRNI